MFQNGGQKNKNKAHVSAKMHTSSFLAAAWAITS